MSAPSSACGTPHPNFYASFNGLTCGVAGLLTYLLALWGIGDVVMRVRGWPQARTRTPPPARQRTGAASQ